MKVTNRVVKISRKDVWNLDYTLARIIHPALIKLKKNKHGSCIVDNEDVPEELRNHNSGFDNDETVHDRWNWALDEMIWAFAQILKPEDFHHHSDNMTLVFTPKADKPKYSEMHINDQVDPNKPKYWYDKESALEYDKRIANGLILFGKYYRGLWD